MTHLSESLAPLKHLPSLYLSAVLIIGSLSLSGLVMGLLWNSYGCPAIARLKTRVAGKWKYSHRYVALWDRLSRGILG